jgi:hypothetical protein
MIKLIVDPLVLHELKTAFPTPANSAEGGLNKYIAVLEAMIEDALLRGQDPYEHKLNLLTLSLHALANKGPQIGPHKIRLHSWLKSNGLELVKTVELGQKFGGKNSKVKLTDLVTLDVIIGPLDSQTQFNKVHPNFTSLSQQVIDTDYDLVDVDLVSVDHYINKISPNGIQPKTRKDKIAFFHAKKIAAIAAYKNGLFYQKKKRSDFGRTYYEGLSVQNVNKQLREAMLGDAWEYDIRSSVVTWKLGYAQDYITANNLTTSIAATFPMCHQYSIDKAVLISQITSQVFTHSTWSLDKQVEKIKAALTALNFGARLTDVTYCNSIGELENPALKDILRDPVELAVFLKCQQVIDFVAEQKKLDQVIIDDLRTNDPKLLQHTELQTVSGRMRTQAVLAYLYQHAETDVMNIVRSLLLQNKVVVLANIHDAIAVRTRIDLQLKQQIEHAMQAATNNSYWYLGEKQLHKCG